MLDSLAGDVSKIDWRRLPVAIVMPLVSLFSGAVLGPEGGIGGISSKLAAMYNEKVGIPVEHRPQLVFSTVASAYNGLIANPLFTGVLGSELIHDPDARARTLPANLIGGAIGYLIFISARAVRPRQLPAPDRHPAARALDVVLVVLFGLLGLGLALIAGAFFRVAAAVFGRFEGREVERALAAGVVFSVVGVFAPIVLFSGETQVQTVVADPAKYGAARADPDGARQAGAAVGGVQEWLLRRTDVPGIFASVCVALAISLMLPGIRTDVLIGGVMAGFLTVLFKAPFMVILLTVVMLQASPEVTALIVLAVAAVLIVQPYILAAIAARQAARASRRVTPS